MNHKYDGHQQNTISIAVAQGRAKMLHTEVNLVMSCN